MKFDLIFTAIGRRPCAMSAEKLLAVLLLAAVTFWLSGCASSGGLGSNVAASESDQSGHATTNNASINRVLLVNTNNGIERYQSAQTAFMQTLHGQSWCRWIWLVMQILLTGYRIFSTTTVLMRFIVLEPRLWVLWITSTKGFPWYTARFLTGVALPVKAIILVLPVKWPPRHS